MYVVACHPTAYFIAKLIQALMVNHDRYGLFRPTANEKGEVIHAEWSTLRNVHLDVS